MKSRLWRRLALLAAAVVVVGVGATQIHRSSGNQVPQYATATVGRGTVDETVSVTGTVQAPVTDNVSFQVSGTVATVPVKLGTQVKAGQTLATLDSSSLQAQLVSAQGQLASAQASLQKIQEGTAPSTIHVQQVAVRQAEVSMQAKVKLDQVALAKAKQALADEQQVYAEALRTYQLETPVTGSLTTLAQYQQTLTQEKATLNSDEQAVTQAQSQLQTDEKTGQAAINAAQAQLQADQAPPLPADVAQGQAAVTQAQAQVQLVQSQIAEMKVTSPVDGIVVQDNIEPGENVSTGEVGFQVQQAGNLEAVVPVDEIDIAKIKVGQATQTTLDALPGQTFSGKVTQIAPTGTASNGVSTYNVTVSLPSNAQLQAGMSATVSFLIGEQTNVLRVPAAAVHGAGKSGTVDVLVNGTPQPRRVGLGLAGDQWTEITSGLQAGETVVVAQAASSTNGGGHFGGPGAFIGGGGHRGG